MLRGGRLDAAFMLPGKAAPLSLQTAAQAARRDIIPGFVPAEQPLTPRAFPPPRIPKDYQPRHVFAEDLVMPGERWKWTVGHCTSVACMRLTIL